MSTNCGPKLAPPRKLVQHREHILNPSQDLLRGVASYQTQIVRFSVSRMQDIFFLEILKAVCLSFIEVPNLVKKTFQTVELNLIQGCETKFDADACKASYANSS